MQRLAKVIGCAGALVLAALFLATGCDNATGPSNGNGVNSESVRIDATVTFEDVDPNEGPGDPSSLDGTITVAGTEYDLETLFDEAGPVLEQLGSLMDGDGEPTEAEIQEIEDAIDSLNREQAAAFRLFFLIQMSIGAMEDEEVTFEELAEIGLVIDGELGEDGGTLEITFDGFPNFDGFDDDDGVAKLFELVLGSDVSVDGALSIDVSVDDQNGQTNMIMQVTGEVTFQQ